jgi:EAL domain-containing protein (putative c-di-GMP-specific phosphodiesterase class I)/FixJ family two-component response regulator
MSEPLAMNERLKQFGSMTVLVVDDNSANVDLLKALLKAEGIRRVICETEGGRISSLLPAVKPDLVLLDLHMPHVDGYEVLDAIRQFAAGTYLPVLVVTADVTPEARNRALAHGARDFLTKPLDVTETTLRIANLLETRQLYADLRRNSGVAGTTEALPSSVPPDTQARTQTVLDERGITPAFQPVVELDTGMTIGYEALARFAQPHKRGPAGWFQDAFHVGLGVKLEWLALTQALPFLELIPTDTFLALNMSLATILHLQQERLCSDDLCPQIVIELTEHVPIEDYGALHDSLEDIRDHGARLAADDVGAGYAGFRHLIALEPDIIKLDISLVSGIHLNRSARALAKALVAFASDVGAVVVAEGVEEAPDLDELREIGVHWAQGYYLGHPSPSSRRD